MTGRGNRFRTRLATALVCWATLAWAVACSSDGPPRPAASPDPLASALAAEMNLYTADDAIRAIIVQVDGRTRYERYFSSSAQSYHGTFSVTKSLMSTLVGIAIGEGRLRLDDRLDRLLPAQAAVMPPRVARVTLRQLLTMTAGFPDTWNGLDPDPLQANVDWTRYILTHQDRPPGEQFHYSDLGAHLLSPILVQATGQSVLAYARAKLFDPLGIPSTPAAEPLGVDAKIPDYEQAGFAWPVDPQGFHTGAAWVKLRAIDMLRFGRLFLQDGRWQGRQVVPAAWVRQATSDEAGAAFAFEPHGAFDPDCYGFLWWVDRVGGADAYFALGYGGQRIEVVPARRMVIVVSSYVDLGQLHPEVATHDDIERLVDIIVAHAG